MEESNQDKLQGVERLRPSEDSDFKPKQTITEGNGKKKGINWILILLIVFVVALAGVMAYFLLLNNNEKTINACNYNGVAYSDGSKIHSEDGCNICTCSNGAISCTEMDCDNDDEDSDTTETTTTSTEEDNDYEGWESYEYTKETRVSSFMYPPDWELSEDKQIISGDIYDMKVSVSKDDYSFVAYVPNSFVPEVCVFSDTDETALSIEYTTVDYSDKEYVEVTSENGTHRRILSEEGYSICTQTLSSEGYFMTGSAPGYLSYVVPENASEDMLETLDLILKSY